MQHTQDIRTKEITLDQIKYAMNLKTIVHPQLSSSAGEDEACPELHQLFMSLLGAVAYLAHTRVDVVVFVSALQRHTAKPQIQHIKKLNKLLTWVQKHPKNLFNTNVLGTSLPTFVLSRMLNSSEKQKTDTVYEECCFCVAAASKPQPVRPPVLLCMFWIGLVSHNVMLHVAHFQLSYYPPGMRSTRVF